MVHGPQSNGSIQEKAMDSPSLKAAARMLFVRMFAVERAGLSTLKEGQQIEYEIVQDRGKTSAVKLTSSDPAASFGRALR
jgi:hypothetical protein